jgi:ABC-type antimicrobial peptide transport system permease subunit
MVGFIEVDDAFLYIYLVVIFAIVAFAIANTFLMAVMERVREFGLLNALGLRGRGVAGLLLTETLLMTTLAMAIGFALGFAGHLAANHWGIPVAIWGVDKMEVSGVDFASLVMRSKITPVKWIAASIMVVLVTLGSALYPAWRASRFAPAEAMRFYG